MSYIHKGILSSVRQLAFIDMEAGRSIIITIKVLSDLRVPSYSA